jgi:hypothetical protein
MSAEENLQRMKTLDDAWNAQNWEVFRKRHSTDTKVYLVGVVRDDSGIGLPGVTVALRAPAGSARETVTDATGAFQFERVGAGTYHLTFTLINFATNRRDIALPAEGIVRADTTLHFAANADVTVTAKQTFTNLADIEHPEENLVGIAQAASQGAIVAKQLEERPLMRDAEVLETVPGVIVTQHSGEGKLSHLGGCAVRGVAVQEAARKSAPADTARDGTLMRFRTSEYIQIDRDAISARNSGQASARFRFSMASSTSAGLLYPTVTQSTPALRSANLIAFRRSSRSKVPSPASFIEMTPMPCLRTSCTWVTTSATLPGPCVA